MSELPRYDWLHKLDGNLLILKCGNWDTTGSIVFLGVWASVCYNIMEWVKEQKQSNKTGECKYGKSR